MVSFLTFSLVKSSAVEDLAPVKTQDSKENFFFFFPCSAFVAFFFSPGSESFPLCSVHLACLLEPARKT